MKATFLEKILDRKRGRLKLAMAAVSHADWRERALHARAMAVPHAFRNAIDDPKRSGIIAEIKRASPSKGIIKDNIDVADIAQSYEFGGACALSVLTEEDFFQGSLDDLRTARKAISLPILQKDFIVYEFQIYQAAEAGADAILLIVAALTRDELKDMHHLAEVVLGLDALVEVHDRTELTVACELGCGLIGVNNRSLHSFDVNLDVSRRLIESKPEWATMVSESGIRNRIEIDELRKLGFSGFLIGESLMRDKDPARTLKAWT